MQRKCDIRPGDRYAQLSMRESRISPMTADDVWPCSSGQAVSKGEHVQGRGRTKGGFDDADLCCCRVKASECTPVVDDEAGTDDVRATVDSTRLDGVRRVDRWTIASTYHQGDLEQTAQFVLILYARLWVHEAALI